MSGELVQYITDHSAAGACASNHYQGQHDPARCVIPAGYCSMIAYLVVLLKNAEMRTVVPAYPSAPIVPVTPVTSDAFPGAAGSANVLNYDGTCGGGGTGSAGGGSHGG